MTSNYVTVICRVEGETILKLNPVANIDNKTTAKEVIILDDDDNKSNDGQQKQQQVASSRPQRQCRQAAIENILKIQVEENIDDEEFDDVNVDVNVNDDSHVYDANGFRKQGVRDDGTKHERRKDERRKDDRRKDDRKSGGINAGINNKIADFKRKFSKNGFHYGDGNDSIKSVQKYLTTIKKAGKMWYV